jgi:hypothetical protein
MVSLGSGHMRILKKRRVHGDGSNAVRNCHEKGFKGLIQSQVKIRITEKLAEISESVYGQVRHYGDGVVLLWLPFFL